MIARLRGFPRHDLFAFLLLVAASLGAAFLLIFPALSDNSSQLLKVGLVAPQDFEAPAGIEYISTVRTEQARQAAQNNVSPIFTDPDPTIARRQLTNLIRTLQFIDGVRNDPNALPAEKRASLAALAEVPLSPASVDALLNFSDTRWLSVQREAATVLERVLRNPVREEQLTAIEQSVPYLISYSLSEDQSSVVAELVIPFITSNSFYSEDLTAAARERASQNVEPITQRYLAGEMVVQRGKVLSEADVEALQKLGFIRSRDLTSEYLGAGSLVAALMMVIGLYYHRRRPHYYNDSRSLALVALLFIIFLAAVRVVIPGRTLLPYAFPLAGFGLLIATLFGPGSALILSIALSVLAAYGYPNALALTLYYLLTSLAGTLALGKAQRFGAFFWAALIASLAGMAVISAYLLPGNELDPLGLLQLLGATLLMGLLSASVALMLQYLLAEFLGLTTALRLVEISRSDSPLLQFFLRNAPGTYQHSLMVSNLAEQAAEKLGMDTLLVRVGALYHDVGKAMNPSFFIENQLLNNLNPHDDVAPAEAAAAIIRHVTDGVLLGRKYRLPKRIQDFMLEHHGTLLTRYQYNKAVEAAGGDASQVDEEKFRYPGPRPHSRETALLMLADNTEARARSMRPSTEAELQDVVQKALEYCQRENQLADTRFTLKDLTIITESFVTTLTGLYHPRISYPNPAERKTP
ncbi:MAG: HDIG domain-containing protein [Anaerolineales bacterium]